MGSKFGRLSAAVGVCVGLVLAGAWAFRGAVAKDASVLGQEVSGPRAPEKPPSGPGGSATGDIYHITDAVSSTHCEYHEMTVPAGGTTVLADLKGPGLITYFYITDDSGGKFDPGLVLKVFWDGDPQPAILVPLADFFGAFDGKTIDYESTFMHINHLSYQCYLPMPFAARARFVLANDGAKPYRRSMAYGIDYEETPRFAAEKGRLCCTWRRSNPVKEGLHTILETRGHGHYVGNFLYVKTLFKGWWGEGDTIFQRDGRSITHTPGTEDEYGSCWGFGKTFAAAYCGYIEDDHGKNRMYRWYARNPVRFREALKVQIQNQHDNGSPAPGDDYTSVAFWYQERPIPALTLAPYAERVAASRAKP